MFLFPSEDVHARNHESFPINFRTSSVTIDDASHLTATLVQEILADSGSFPWYTTDSVAVHEDSYSDVVVNVIDLPVVELGSGAMSEKSGEDEAEESDSDADELGNPFSDDSDTELD